MIGSIQYTNDIDVQVALVTAPSYAKHMAEKYYTSDKTSLQQIREYVDLFGFFQKNPNALDIAIEEAKSTMKLWGSKDPTFMLTNSRLTFQMQMTPEKTQYITQGTDGEKRLKTGPDIKTYRGLNIINSRYMSLEDGAPPRDILRRRVRVAEYHWIPAGNNTDRMYSFYNEASDAWQKISFNTLCESAFKSKSATTAEANTINLLVVRPCIEHNMLGIIIGRGGLEDLGGNRALSPVSPVIILSSYDLDKTAYLENTGTLWGQTELSVYDDSQYGIWGCSYKYNARSIVWNEKVRDRSSK